ncbi:hypothetical protein [Sandarakinorhabdus sp.]
MIEQRRSTDAAANAAANARLASIEAAAAQTLAALDLLLAGKS